MEIKNYLTVKNITFFALIIFIIYLLIKMTDIALLLFCSYVISSAINPIVDKMQKRMSRSTATTIMIFAITLVTLGVFTPIIIMSVNEISQFIENLPEKIETVKNFISTFQIAGQDISGYLNLDTLLNNSTTIAREVIGKSINITIGVLGILTILVTIGIIVFFLTNDREKIKSFVLKLFPMEVRERTSVVIDDVEAKVGGYISAQLSCITIVGLVVAICLGLLGVEYAVFLGFISAILDLVPIVGPFLTGALILLAAFPKGWIICILAVGSLLLAQFIENNWAKPYFFSKYMDLHPLVVIFSFVVAAKFLGVVGVLIAPAIAAVLVTLFEEIYVKTMNSDTESANKDA